MMTMCNKSKESDAKELAMRCPSCKEDYDMHDLGTCGGCYEEANEVEEELRQEIEDLKSKLSFLTLPTPDYNDSAVDVYLVPVNDPDDVPIPAHKHLLVTRSPYFRKMLKNYMTDRRKGIIKISGVSYDTLYAFVNYLYTAEVSLDNELACNLLVLGEKYQVKHLKTYCEKYLIAKMSWTKAVSNYALAFQYNCKQLLSESLALIFDHMDSLTEDKCYAKLLDTNPRLVAELYETYIGMQLNTAV